MDLKHLIPVPYNLSNLDLPSIQIDKYETLMTFYQSTEFIQDYAWSPA